MNQGYWNISGAPEDFANDLSMEMIEKLVQLNNSICYIFHDVDMIPVKYLPRIRIQSPPLSRITLGQHISDNINQTIQSADAFVCC